eukprot:scaffold1157_cov122-Cylindrotheca_fusiformis.AAC.26
MIPLPYQGRENNFDVFVAGLFCGLFLRFANAGAQTPHSFWATITFGLARSFQIGANVEDAVAQ